MEKNLETTGEAGGIKMQDENGPTQGPLSLPLT